MCPDSNLFIDTMKIIGEKKESVPVTTHLETMVLADTFLFLLALLKASL